MSDNELFEKIKETIGGYDFIRKCLSVERCGLAAKRHIAVTLESNVPSNDIRNFLTEDLELKYPDQKFRFMFMTTI